MSFRNRLLPFQQHLVGLVLMIKRSGHTKGLIIDVGSFDGGSTSFLAKHCPEATVIGFEANPKLFERAKQRYNNERISFENYAVSNKKGRARFHVSDNEVSSSMHEIKERTRFKTDSVIDVETVSLDEYWKEKQLNNNTVLALKIDVQGHELPVLQGASELLEKTHFVLIEMANHNDYAEGSKYDEVNTFLRNKGFTLGNLFSDFDYEVLYEYDAIYVNKSNLRKK